MTEISDATVALSDAELIAAARSGDPEAYAALYERHAPPARRLASQLMRRPADVDDVVAETFTRVLGVMRRGGGPAEAFRPYLLTAVRRVAIDQLSGQSKQIPTEQADIPDLGEPFIDPAVASFERSLIARAFMSLPERWTAVLWHTVIEQGKPADVAVLLGLTPNGVAALSYRAREGLRQAYLQMHLSGIASEECRPVAGRLGAHVRGGLSMREGRKVDRHLRSCGDCQHAHAELASVNGSLRGLLAPIFLGGAAAAYLSGSAGHAAAGSAAAGAGSAWNGSAWNGSAGNGLRWLGRAVRHPVLPVAAGVLLTAVAIPAATLTHPHPSSPRGVIPGSIPLTRQHPGRTVSAGASAAPPLAPPAPSSKSSSAPSPTALPTGSPTASPQPSPTPGLPPVLLAAQLSVGVDVNGLLALGLVTVVDVHVADTGGAATARLTADLALPPGTVLLGLAGSGPKTWKCSTSAAGVNSCAHGPIAAGAASSVAVRILVVSLSGCGDPVLATVTSGALSASGHSAGRVPCAGPLL